jgi:hypothetical protein
MTSSRSLPFRLLDFFGDAAGVGGNRMSCDCREVDAAIVTVNPSLGLMIENFEKIGAKYNPKQANSSMRRRVSVILQCTISRRAKLAQVFIRSFNQPMP